MLRSALVQFSPSLTSVNQSVPSLDYNVFIAATLRYAVTMTFDPLTLNISSVLAVTWSNSVPNFIEMSSPRRSHRDLNLLLSLSAILELTGSRFSQFCGLRGPILHQNIKFQHNLAMHG